MRIIGKNNNYYVVLSLFIFALLGCPPTEDETTEAFICPPSSVRDCNPSNQVISNQLIVELLPGYTQTEVMDSCLKPFFIFQLATDFLGIHPDSIKIDTVLRSCNCNLMLLDIELPDGVELNDGKIGAMSPPKDQDDGNPGLIASVGMNYNVNLGPFNSPYDTIAIAANDTNCIVFHEDPNRIEGDTLCTRVHIDETSSNSLGSELTLIACIDTGVDPGHPYKSNKQGELIKFNEVFYLSEEVEDFIEHRDQMKSGDSIIINRSDDNNNCVPDDLWGVDYFHNDNNPLDRKGHGTHVIHTILSAKEAIDTSGIRMMALQVGGYKDNVYNKDNFKCDLFSILCSIDYARMSGVHIINMSLGYYNPDVNGPFHNQIRKASLAGILIVTSAGNDKTNIDDCHHWPSNFSEYFPNNVIAVAALDTFDVNTTTFQLADYSNYGEHADIAAPGTLIESAQAGTWDGRIKLSGTSMAAAVVSRRAAIIRDSVFMTGDTISAPRIKAQILQEAHTQNAFCVRDGRVLTHHSDPTLLRAIGYED